MIEKHLYILLNLIQNQTDVRQLIHVGLDYKEIGELTSFAFKENYLIYELNKVILTAKGIEKLNSDAKRFKKINKEEWIQPEIKSRINKIDNNYIFLPSQDDLSF